jgi:hypothetical protein
MFLTKSTTDKMIDLYIMNFSVLEIRWNISNSDTEQPQSADIILLISI